MQKKLTKRELILDRGMMAEEIMRPAACPGQWALLVGETPTLRCCSSGAPNAQITREYMKPLLPMHLLA